MYIKSSFLIFLTAFILLNIACSNEVEQALESSCTEIVAPNYAQILLDDPYTINNVSLTDENELKLNVSYSGGCSEHEFELMQDPIFCGTPPIFICIKLNHNANNDLCEALLTKEVCFDISAIYANHLTEDISVGLYNNHQTDTTWIFQ